MKSWLWILGIVGVAVMSGCSYEAAEEAVGTHIPAPPENLADAYFAGGCFWCMEKAFEQMYGVDDAISGFAGGTTADPTYDQVASGRTDYTETVRVIYDPQKITYWDLLQVYWRWADPTDAGGQFVDRGAQYRPAIFFQNEQEQIFAETAKAALARSGIFDEPLVVEVQPLQRFYAAEDYHQDFYKTNPLRYYSYEEGSGRLDYRENTWPAAQRELDFAPVEAYADFTKPADSDLRERLSEVQFRVTQQDGTERAFQNPFHDQKAEGIYVDIVSGEPLYSSRHKFDSGTGWPSFTRPLERGHIVERRDGRYVEVRSRFADSHLGHLFADGPPPTGIRHCINSAALRFIPREKLQAEGYGRYLTQFEE